MLYFVPGILFQDSSAVTVVNPNDLGVDSQWLHSRLLEWANHLEEQILTEIKCLMEEFAKFDSKPFWPFLLLQCTFSNVLCYMTFGKRYEYNDPKFGHLLILLYLLRRIVEIVSYAGAVTFIPFLKYVPFSGARKLLNFPEYRQFFENMVEENAKEFILISPEIS